MVAVAMFSLTALVLLTSGVSKKGLCFDGCMDSCNEAKSVCYPYCVGACVQGDGRFNLPAFAINFHIDNITEEYQLG